MDNPGYDSLRVCRVMVGLKDRNVIPSRSGTKYGCKKGGVTNYECRAKA